MTTIISPAPKAARVRHLIITFIGVPVLALLGSLWLGIPDSHLWQLALSLVAGAIIALAFLWTFSSTVRSLRGTATPCAHWLGAVLLAAWLCIQWYLVHLIGLLDDDSMARAGYLNSKLSAGMRATFTFDRLTAWQHDLSLVLIWIVIPALMTPFVIETVSCGLSAGVWRVAARTVARWQHWLVIVVCDVAIYWLTDKLTGWRPSHSVHGELISLAVRLSLCYMVDFALVVLLLSVDSRLLAREHARRNPAAEPTANTA